MSSWYSSFPWLPSWFSSCSIRVGSVSGLDFDAQVTVLICLWMLLDRDRYATRQILRKMTCTKQKHWWCEVLLVIVEMFWCFCMSACWELILLFCDWFGLFYTNWIGSEWEGHHTYSRCEIWVGKLDNSLDSGSVTSLYHVDLRRLIEVEMFRLMSCSKEGTAFFLLGDFKLAATYTLK